MGRRSPRAVAEAWRKQGLSGQPLGRLAMGAASRGTVFLLGALTPPVGGHPALCFFSWAVHDMTCCDRKDRSPILL